jgi:hypothetical protein
MKQVPVVTFPWPELEDTLLLIRPAAAVSLDIIVQESQWTAMSKLQSSYPLQQC